MKYLNLLIFISIAYFLGENHTEPGCRRSWIFLFAAHCPMEGAVVLPFNAVAKSSQYHLVRIGCFPMAEVGET
ncbi:MAG: hypothetical protein WAT51_01750, partial [Holophaga sp.]